MPSNLISRRPSSTLLPLIEGLETRRLLAALTWDAGGDGTSWDDAQNWSDDAVPTLADDVTIGSATTTAIQVTGDAEVRSLTTTRRIVVTGSLRVADGQLATFHNILHLRGGTIIGGIWDFEQGEFRNNLVSDGVAAGITLRSDISIVTELFIEGGIVLDGADVEINDGTGKLSFRGGDQSISGTGRVISDRTPISSGPQVVKLYGNHTVTVESGVSMEGRLDIIDGDSASNATLINNGAILTNLSSPGVAIYNGFRVATQHLINNGLIEATANADLHLQSQTTINNGTITMAAGSGSGSARGLANGPAGVIDVDGVEDYRLNKFQQNDGLISVRNTALTLDLNARPEAASIGTLLRQGSTVKLGGDFDNTGRTLDPVALLDGPVTLQNASIVGGTLVSDPANRLSLGSFGDLIFDGLTFEGPLNTERYLFDTGTDIAVRNVLTVNDALVIDESIDFVFDSGPGRINAPEIRILNGGRLDLLLRNNTFFTLETDVIVDRGGLLGVNRADDSAVETSFENVASISIGDSNSSLSTNGIFDVRVDHFYNSGSVTANERASVLLRSDTINRVDGVIELQPNSDFTLEKSWKNDGTFLTTNALVQFAGSLSASDVGTWIRTAGIVRLSGTLNNTGTDLNVIDVFRGQLGIVGGTVVGGTLDADGIESLYIDGNIARFIDNVTLRGNFTVNDGTKLVVEGGLTLDSATLVLDEEARLSFNGDVQRLAGAGRVSRPADSSSGAARIALDDGAEVTIDENIVISGGNLWIGGSSVGSATGLLTVNGLLEAGVAGETMKVIAPALGRPLDIIVKEGGTLEVGGGALKGKELRLGQVRVVDGGTLTSNLALETLVADIEVIGTNNRLAGSMSRRVTLLEGSLSLDENSSLSLGDQAETLEIAATVTLAGGSTLDAAGSVVLNTSWTSTAGPDPFGRLVSGGSVDLRGLQLNLFADARQTDLDLVVGDVFPLIEVGGGLVGQPAEFSVDETASDAAIGIVRDSNNTLDAKVFAEPATQPPSILGLSYEFETEQVLRINFDQDVSAYLTADDFVLTNLTSAVVPTLDEVELDWDEQNLQATVHYDGTLPNSSYRLSLAPTDLANAFGVAGTGTAATLDFFVLAGDANRDRQVSILDFAVLRSNFGSSDATFSQGDFNYDGQVSILDFAILRVNFGQSLPAPSASLFADEEAAFF